MSPVFAHGALRLYLLALLEDEPRHGYELIRLMEDRFMGLYTPSAGTVYPRLGALEDMGLVEHDVIDGKKVYRLTEAGRAEVAARREEIDDAVAQAVRSAGQLAREIRDDVRASVRDLRQELRDAVKDVRREERRIDREVERSAREAAVEAGREARAAGREARDVAREAAREARRLARDTRAAVKRQQHLVHAEVVEDADDLRTVLRSLKRDLEAFVTDVVAAARQHGLDADRMRQVRGALVDARETVLEALAADDAEPRRPRR